MSWSPTQYSKFEAERSRPPHFYAVRTRARREAEMTSVGAMSRICDYAKAENSVRSKAPDAKCSQKADWGDPVMRAIGRATTKKAAPVLGVTVGSARLAERRHLGAAATKTSREGLVAGRTGRIVTRYGAAFRARWRCPPGEHRKVTLAQLCASPGGSGTREGFGRQ